ncbi:hypothetical protein M3Y98_00103500 [Aphelenchoides besseyi]|nr:hypothetical protein M3Y98_00103500 [Aphelenchoides besseyi]KAI6194460.1 hypothetical protein M3Y96_01127300 [Aphelenchoides besseyi]
MGELESWTTPFLDRIVNSILAVDSGSFIIAIVSVNLFSVGIILCFAIAMGRDPNIIRDMIKGSPFYDQYVDYFGDFDSKAAEPKEQYENNSDISDDEKSKIEADELTEERNNSDEEVENWSHV